MKIRTVKWKTKNESKKYKQIKTGIKISRKSKDKTWKFGNLDKKSKDNIEFRARRFRWIYLKLELVE